MFTWAEFRSYRFGGSKTSHEINTPILGYVKDQPKFQPMYMHGITGM